MQKFFIARVLLICAYIILLGLIGCAAERSDRISSDSASDRILGVPQEVTHPTLADQLDPPPPAGPRFWAEGDFFYGPIKGYLQTPAGGAPGSTSHNRPRLGELGIHDAYIGQATLAATWDHNELFGGAEIIRLSGNDTLHEDLTTHGTTFAAGTSVSSDVSLDWYRFGYRYHAGFFPAANDVPQLLLAPYADVLIWDFSYSISGGGAHASRAYIKPTGQLGIQAGWAPGGGAFSLNLDLSASPPGISSLPFIAAEQLDARYRFVETGRFSASALLGVRFEQINFFDDQTVPNHIRADLGPMGVVGVVIGF